MVRRVCVGLGLSILLVSVQAVGAGPESPQPVSPGSRVNVATVAEGCPTFSWSSVARASAYRLVVYEVTAQGELGEAVIQHRVSAGVSSWTPSLEQGLVVGGSYAWTAGAVTPKGETLWSEPAFFRVAGRPSQDEIERALAILDAAYGDRRSPETGETAPSEVEVAAEPTGLEGTLLPVPIDVGPKVRFEGGIGVTPAWGGTLVLGSNSDFNLAFDGDEIMARRAGQAATLRLNKDGGAISLGGPLLAYDDVDLTGHDLWQVGRLQLGYTIVSGTSCTPFYGVTVLCPYPYKVIGGGCFTSTRDALIGSYPYSDHGWRCRVDYDDYCRGTAYAICANLR